MTYTVRAIFGVAIVAMLSIATMIAASAQAPTGCRGLPIRYETTIGSIGPIGKKPRAASVVGIAAVTLAGDDHAGAWVIWDERGLAWLALVRNSPPAFRALWPANLTLDFGGKGPQPRYSLMTKALPSKFRLLDCQNALP